MRKLAAQGAKPCGNDIPSDLLAANCIPPGFMVQTGWDIVCDYYQVYHACRSWGMMSWLGLGLGLAVCSVVLCSPSPRIVFCEVAGTGMLQWRCFLSLTSSTPARCIELGDETSYTTQKLPHQVAHLSACLCACRTCPSIDCSTGPLTSVFFCILIPSS